MFKIDNQKGIRHVYKRGHLPTSLTVYTADDDDADDDL
jgi:hypothetical protein